MVHTARTETEGHTRDTAMVLALSNWMDDGALCRNKECLRERSWLQLLSDKST